MPYLYLPYNIGTQNTNNSNMHPDKKNRNTLAKHFWNKFTKEKTKIHAALTLSRSTSFSQRTKSFNQNSNIKNQQIF